MLVTSLTSAVAFAATTMSKIMPIRSFGIFATIIVPLVYLQTIIVQPFTYFIYEKYFMHRKLFGVVKVDHIEPIDEKDIDLDTTPI